MTLQFDEAYYRRFYKDPSTRVYDQKRHAHLISGVVGLIEWFGVDLIDVLDVGAGLGWWGQWLKKNRKGTTVISTELDREICRKYGHQQADISTFRLEKQFELVICQGVLPYITDATGASAAIENLAAMCGGFLYLEAITQDDMKDAIDAHRTDLRVELRPAAWYRKRLLPHFREVGGGLYAARRANLPFFALEAPRDTRR
ncbi:MAG: SAM-dependent methyltransferase [Archangium sp.]|nr:SAM-dependent methyltransferase [Archangium sp.]MDP3151211.1 SAM-dependent methyltransferase [Archangium sp.]MDP3570148.1 SAM-dependent methyltransferase [Archangium sp.]